MFMLQIFSAWIDMLLKETVYIYVYIYEYEHILSRVIRNGKRKLTIQRTEENNSIAKHDAHGLSIQTLF